MKKTRSEGELAGFEIANPFLSVQGFLKTFFPLKLRVLGHGILVISLFIVMV